MQVPRLVDDAPGAIETEHRKVVGVPLAFVQVPDFDKSSVTLYRETYDPKRGGRGFVLPIPALGDVLLDEITAMVPGGLPSGAFKYEAWWNNDDDTHSHCRSWGNAGFYARPDLARRLVRFEPR